MSLSMPNGKMFAAAAARLFQVVVMVVVAVTALRCLLAKFISVLLHALPIQCAAHRRNVECSRLDMLMLPLVSVSSRCKRERERVLSAV